MPVYVGFISTFLVACLLLIFPPISLSVSVLLLSFSVPYFFLFVYFAVCLSFCQSDCLSVILTVCFPVQYICNYVRLVLLVSVYLSISISKCTMYVHGSGKLKGVHLNHLICICEEDAD